ncbi:uncharacterized protein FA14DRAFT_188013 [Meira miltonrushii]|uniref:Uncharacterized protein n=1 Tax=Meira miltonrushii TaxID=1280837 RepID=A0A316VJV7_9BASI|nr:uncharacterized protein FA14DRAFT_188013 [Meira miltonrushii]PWN37967.1 hypothetical protein FA14DRAFT_188013 [Meira miltonrushii]
MFKFTSGLVAILAITSMVVADSGRTKGYRQVPTGAISHCGINTGQQCFTVETGLDNFAVLTDEPLDIACDPSGLCILPFDFDKRGKTSFFIGQCLNNNGEVTGSAINVTLGLRSVSAHSSAYASFVLRGNMKAKWAYDDVYTTSPVMPYAMAAGDPGNQGEVPHEESGEGYRVVKNGTIGGCGDDTTQQCYQVKPLSRIAVYTKFNDTVLDTICELNGLCVTPFDFETDGQKLEITVKCLDNKGYDQKADVRMDLGKGSVEGSSSSAYSFFVARGHGVSAKWQSDAGYTSNNHDPKPSSKRAEELFIRCPT